MIRPSRMALALVLAAVAAACSRSPRASERAVVLYSSVDEHILRPIVQRFEDESGVRVLVHGDTEATKTTGLVLRLLAERDRPRADVWWSSEPLGTIRLAREGLLAQATTPTEADFPGGWPASMRDPGGTWFGFASRARVIAFSSARLPDGEAPRTLEALADPRWKGRVGMARPQFGTTRAHMAALAAACGPDALRDWLERMKANGLRLYDGNSSVVRAVAQGEIDLGLTDTDDVFAAQREGWAVGMVFETTAPGGGGLCSPGPLLLPNTAAVIRGAPHPREAQALLDFILSEQTERALARSESRNIPLRPGLAGEGGLPVVPSPASIPFDAAADAAEEAVRVCSEVLGG